MLKHTFHSSQRSPGYGPPFSIRATVGERPTGAEATKQDELGTRPMKHVQLHIHIMTSHNLDVFVTG